jgi:hypothetical protein
MVLLFRLLFGKIFLVSDGVSVLFDGLNDLFNNWGLLDLTWWWDSVGGWGSDGNGGSGGNWGSNGVWGSGNWGTSIGQAWVLEKGCLGGGDQESEDDKLVHDDEVL